jgi:hypothetical protein
MMIGVHGNGLTHEMWMPEDATLIEVSTHRADLRMRGRKWRLPRLDMTNAPRTGASVSEAGGKRGWKISDGLLVSGARESLASASLLSSPPLLVALR